MTVVLQYKTDLIPILRVPTRTIQPNFVYVIPDDSDPKGRMVYLELTPPPDVTYKTIPGSSQQMNVLGIVIFSATMGEEDVGQCLVVQLRDILKLYPLFGFHSYITVAISGDESIWQQYFQLV